MDLTQAISALEKIIEVIETTDDVLPSSEFIDMWNDNLDAINQVQGALLKGLQTNQLDLYEQAIMFIFMLGVLAGIKKTTND